MESNTAAVATPQAATASKPKRKPKTTKGNAPAQSVPTSNDAETKHPLLNAVIRKEFAPVIEGRVSELATEAHLSMVADNLPVIKVNDDNMVPVQLRRFPMAYSQSGRINGKLMNISQFCRMKTGQAWNDKHAARVKDTEGVVLHVLPSTTEADKQRRKALSEDLDKMRPEFYAECKGVAASFVARTDSQVEKARLRQTSRGIVMDVSAIIPSAKSSEADKLRAELAKANELLKAYEGKLPAKVRNQVRKQVSKPIDVASIVQQQQEQIQQIAQSNTEPAATAAH